MGIYDNHLSTNAANGPLWATATSYNIGDIVTQNTAVYICVTAHTSGTFATDLTAAKWSRSTAGYQPSSKILQLVAPTDLTVIVKGTALGGTTPSLGGSTPANTPTAPVSSVITATDTPSAPSLAGSTYTPGGSTPSLTTGLIRKDIALGNIPVMAATVYPVGVPSGTATMQQGTATPVDNGIFNVATSTFSTGVNNIQVKVTPASPGSSTDSVLSNVIPITANVITNTQMSNTTGSQFTEDLSAMGPSSSPAEFFIFNSSLYFPSANSNLSQKLFKLTTGGTLTQASNTCGSQSNNDFDTNWKPIIFNGSMYFIARANVGGSRRIHKMDTSGTITIVAGGLDIPGAASTDCHNFFIFNSRLYFIAAENVLSLTTGGNKLWYITTADDPHLVTNQNGSLDDFTLSELQFSPVIFNSAMYFPMSTGTWKIFKLTTGGALTQITNVNAGNDIPINGNSVFQATIMSSKLYFVGLNANAVSKIFSIDTSDTVTQVTNIAGSQTAADVPAPGNYNNPLVSFNSSIYFFGNGSSAVTKLFQLNSSNVVTQITNLTGDQTVADSLSFPMFVFSNILYFQGGYLGQQSPQLLQVNTSNVVSAALSSAADPTQPNGASATTNPIIGSTNFMIGAYSAELNDTLLSQRVPFVGTTDILTGILVTPGSSAVRVTKTNTNRGSGTGDFANAGTFANNFPGIYFNSTYYFWAMTSNQSRKLFRL